MQGFSGFFFLRPFLGPQQNGHSSQTTPERFITVHCSGAGPNPTGDPIGGSEGYSRILTEGDYSFSGVDKLLQPLEAAQSSEVVYVAADAAIDLGDRKDVMVPESVTVADNRGQDGAPGAGYEARYR